MVKKLLADFIFCVRFVSQLEIRKILTELFPNIHSFKACTDAFVPHCSLSTGGTDPFVVSD